VRAVDFFISIAGLAVGVVLRASTGAQITLGITAALCVLSIALDSRRR
jgi:hypothetical protein